MTPADLLGTAVVALVWIHATMAAVAVVAVAWGRRRAPAPGPLPAYTLLRPLEGADAGLAENLESLLEGPHPPSQILLCVPSHADPAAPIARAALAAHPEIPGAVVTSEGGPAWPNRKVRHLLSGLPAATADVLVFADADVRAAPETIPALLATLGDAGVAYAASCPSPEGSAAAVLQSALLGHGFHAFQVLAALSAITGGTPAMVGGLWAVRRADLDRLGGLQIAATHIGDDLRMAEAADAAGLRVAISPAPAPIADRGATLGEVFARAVRWIGVLKAHQPHKVLGYPALMAHLPLLLALGIAAAPVAPEVGPALALAVTARWLMALYLGRINRLPWRPGVLLWVLGADLLLLVAFLVAAPRRSVVWRGRRYALAPGGAIQEVG